MKEAGNSQTIPVRSQNRGGGRRGITEESLVTAGLSLAPSGWTLYTPPILTTALPTHPAPGKHEYPFLPRRFCTPGS